MKRKLILQQRSKAEMTHEVLSLLFAMVFGCISMTIFPCLLMASESSGHEAIMENYRLDSLLNVFSSDAIGSGQIVATASGVVGVEREIAKMTYYPQFDPPAPVNPNETTTIGSSVAATVSMDYNGADNADEPTADLGR